MDKKNISDSNSQKKEKQSFRRTVVSTVLVLAAAVAAAVLMANLWLPVLEIYGRSMTPTLREGDVVVAIKDKTIEQGDIIAFYHGNKLVIKRCIAVEGDVVSIGADGTVSVNDVPMDEPYIQNHHNGGVDVEMPCKVPEGQCFVVGDNREMSVDSRHTAMGCVDAEQTVGRIFLRVWPFSQFGWVR